MDAFRASPLGELIEAKSAEKFIPTAVWEGGWGVKRAFLMACFEGDGGPRKGADNAFSVHYTTYSDCLAGELQQLLAEFGVIATRHRYTKASGAIEHRLIISGLRNVKAFAERVGFLRTKQAKLEELIRHAPIRPHRLTKDHVPYVADFVRSELDGQGRGSGRTWLMAHNFDRMERWETERLRIIDRIKDPEILATILPIMDSGYRFEAVTSVTDEAPAEVYSIRVDSEDHSFLAGGFINHNTECRLALLANETARRHRREHRRLRAELHLRVRAAVGAAGAVPEPAGQRVARHRRRHGHEHPAAQPRRGHRRDDAPDRQPERHARRPHEVRPRPRLPDGWAHPRAPRHHRRLSHRPRLDPRAGARPRSKKTRRAACRSSSPSCRTRRRSAPSRRASPSSSTTASSTASATFDNLSSGIETKLVIGLKRDANALVVLNNLFKHTQLQSSFAVNMVALVDGVPAHAQPGRRRCRPTSTTRSTSSRGGREFRLEEGAGPRPHRRRPDQGARHDRRHHRAGPRVRRPRRGAHGSDGASGFEFSEIQANYILDMTIVACTRLSAHRARPGDEGPAGHDQGARRHPLQAGGAARRHQDASSARSQASSPRRAAPIITHDPGELGAEDFINDDPLVFLMTRAGYVKTVAAGSFRTQGRGGRGIAGAKLKEEDLVSQVIHTTAHEFILFFSNRAACSASRRTRSR